MEEILTQLTIDQDRLSQEIDRLAACSATAAPGVTRILYTKEDTVGRELVADYAQQAGLEISVDALGNTFITWKGSQPELPKVATGSHIDAIPHSGKYDGVVGVLGAIEALRALKATGFQPQRTIEIILFTAEEPTRFGIGCLGSRALANTLSVAQLQALKDPEGGLLDPLRQAAGFQGALSEVPLHAGDYHSFVELHIEQGPELEAAGCDIGAVTAIAAPATVRLIIHGSGGHAGACTMPVRKDALIPAAEMALFVQQVALESVSEDAVATTGLFQVHPGAVNSIPSRVTLEIDIRDTELASRDHMVQRVLSEASRLRNHYQIEIESTILNEDPPATCLPALVDLVMEVSKQEAFKAQRMISRAYHDTLFMSQICPTTMIFVPSKNGYSHRPEEYTSPEEIRKGVKVLAATLAKLSYMSSTIN
ncbi:MAG: M20 family metallo-hydrolase [Bacteroidota bacterium]